MPTDFGHLKAYDPTGRKTWYVLPLKGAPRLQLIHAGGGNSAYVNALTETNTATGAARRAIAQSGDAASVMKANLDIDRELFPLHVITGWEGIRNASGKELPFSADVCAEFLAALPDWIVRKLSTFASISSNFLDNEALSQELIDDQAGK